jgi:hypothetical protein
MDINFLEQETLALNDIKMSDELSEDFTHENMLSGDD